MDVDEETTLLLRELKSFKVLEVIETGNDESSLKCARTSLMARQLGNEIVVKQHHTTQDHYDILKFYCKSIAFAPNQSEELARAYGNRSALLLHLEKYKECIVDVDRALAITRATDLIEQLTKRKEKCFQLMNLTNEIDELQKRKTEACKELSENETRGAKNTIRFFDLSIKGYNDNLLSQECSFKSVDIRYNTTFGRHLTATRYIRPGEIILVEKPYVNNFNFQNPYRDCGHCLAVNWTGIPCHQCGWIMYCSEKCKNEAWEQYHDIECLSMSYINDFTDYAKSRTGKDIRFDGLIIRAMLRGLKQAGSFEKLKEQMKRVDQCTDESKKGFSENGKFETDKFISLYSLPRGSPKSMKKSKIMFVAIALSCLAKHTKLFDDAFNNFSIAALLKNRDAIFIGTVLMKLSLISGQHSSNVKNAMDKCKYFREEERYFKQNCCMRRFSSMSIINLTVNNCNSNASGCFTNNQKCVLYAIQPIMKNTEISMAHCFHLHPYYKESTLQRTVPTLWEIPLLLRYNSLMQSIFQKSIQFDQTVLDNISRAVENTVNIPQPSLFSCDVLQCLRQVFEALYGYNTEICEKY